MNQNSPNSVPPPLRADKAYRSETGNDDTKFFQRDELQSFQPIAQNGPVVSSPGGLPPLSYNPQSKWVPYEDSHNEMPLWRWLCACYYRCRYPLMRLARFSIIRLYKFEITIGGLLLFAIFFALFGFHSGYVYTQNRTDTSNYSTLKPTGVAASVSLLVLFSIAGRNSIWAVLLGIPYERICLWHKIITLAVIGQGGFHAWIVYNNNLGGKDECVSGWILYGLICGMFVLTMPVIWLGFYRTFWIFHRLVVIAIIVLVGIHGAYYTYIGI